jgi:hypothetical protein
MTRDHEAVMLEIKKPCYTVSCDVTQVVGASTEVRPEFELFTQVAGIKSVLTV